MILEKTISRFLENWDLGRIALLDNLILQMAVCELLFFDDVPPIVSISEAIEMAKKYSIKAVKHSAYFFPWNDDPLNIFEDIWERWRPLKFLGGFSWNEYENNTPKDGVVDRIQIVRYPPGTGQIEPHSDPYLNQRFFISTYLSKKGKDYVGGGVYLVGNKGEKIDIENQIDIGDMSIGYSTLIHGVDPVNINSEPNINKTDGRWFLGLYSNDSDHKKDRHTAKPEKSKMSALISDE